MTEVFKTTVTSHHIARILMNRLHQTFPFYKVNFDLQDCDRILRVSSTLGMVDSLVIFRIIEEAGFQAEVLPDQAPVPANCRLLLLL